MFVSVFFAFKTRLQELKFELCQIKLGRITDKLAIDKILLELDSNSSLLLECGSQHA